MKTLRWDRSKELFDRAVFGSEKECPLQFRDVSDQILRKCGGLALAITCIASLVANQPEHVNQWEQVRNFLHENLRINSTSVEIQKQVLNLCYISLPHCLETCLLYLNMYPENYILLKEDLVKQWIAEDFICATEEKDIVEVASSFFDEMVSLGLIQRIDISNNKKGVPYVVHPLVFEFIKCQSIEGNFITVIDYSQSTVALTEKIRRLSLQFGSTTYATTPAGIGPLQVRSLSFMGLLNCMPALAGFKLVRVIILHVLVDNGDTSFPLTGVCELLLLRYLQVRCNVTVELPDQIGCLKHLETLDIHAVAAVPSDIFYLLRLLHLRVGRKRYRHHHKQLILSYLSNARSLDNSSSASSNPVPTFVFQIIMIPRPPRWIGHFCNLCYLDAVVRELQPYDIDALAELWALTVLLLYVRRTANIHLKRGAFPALKYFRYMCGGVILLTFDEGAMHNLSRLNIGFNAHKEGEYEQMIVGIHHLLNLQEVSASIGAAFRVRESDRRAAESALVDVISKHPRLSSFKLQSFDNWTEETESSNEQDEALKKQHWAQNEALSNDQSGVLGKIMPVKKHADTSDERPETQAMEKVRYLVWLLAIFLATITYEAGLRAPGSIWQDYVHMAKQYKAFFYCNSVAFMASLITIILLQKGVLLQHLVLKAAMILTLLCLMVATHLGSQYDMSIPIFYSDDALLNISLVFIVVPSSFVMLVDTTGINRKWSYTLTKAKEALMAKKHYYFLLLAVLLVMVCYQGPSRFWCQSGLHVSDQILLIIYYLRRYQNTFEYWLSIGGLTCALYYMHMGVIRQRNTVCYLEVASGIMMYICMKYANTSTRALFLPLLVMITVITICTVGEKQDGNNWASVVENYVSNPSAPVETEDGNRLDWYAKGIYMIVLGFVTVRVIIHTCQVLLMVAVWQGGSIDNLVMKEDWAARHHIYLYSSSFAFMASIVIILLRLLQLVHDGKWLLRVMNTMVLLDLLGLLVAYVAGSFWWLKTIEYVSVLTVAVLV